MIDSIIQLEYRFNFILGLQLRFYWNFVPIGKSYGMQKYLDNLGWECYMWKFLKKKKKSTKSACIHQMLQVTF